MLRVDYDALATSAQTLANQGDIFEDCISAMSTVINGLPDIWEADTCDKYVEQYNEAKTTLDDVRNLIQEMSDQMTTISQNFRDTDTDMAGQM